MHIETYARQVQSELGWTDATLLSVCLNYIAYAAGNQSFKTYLSEIVEEEKEN